MSRSILYTKPELINLIAQVVETEREADWIASLIEPVFNKNSICTKDFQVFSIIAVGYFNTYFYSKLYSQTEYTQDLVTGWCAYAIKHYDFDLRYVEPKITKQIYYKALREEGLMDCEVRQHDEFDLMHCVLEAVKKALHLLIPAIVRHMGNIKECHDYLLSLRQEPSVNWCEHLMSYEGLDYNNHEFVDVLHTYSYLEEFAGCEVY